ncbi:MAG: hypothetical protein K2N74_01630 [Clostridiales bacterium]|nr:hypothetical protein [Clostridiales bacterium]
MEISPHTADMRKIIRILSALFVIFVLGMFISCTTPKASGTGEQSTRAITLPHREPNDEEKEEERDGIVIPVPPQPVPMN